MSLQLIFLKIKQNIIKVLLFIGLYFLYAILFLDTSSEIMAIGFYQSSKHLFLQIVVVASLASSINAFTLNFSKVKNQLSFGYTRKGLLLEVISRIVVIAIFLVTILLFHNLFLVLLGQKMYLFPFSYPIDLLLYFLSIYFLFSGVGYILGIMGKSQFLFLGMNGIVLLVVLFALFFQTFVLLSIVLLLISISLYSVGSSYFYKKKF